MLAFRQFGESILQIPKLKQITLDEVDGVHVFENEDTGKLALSAIEEVLEARQIQGQDIALVIDYSTVSRDINGISLCYKVQRELQAHNALTLAIGNGSCISFQLALQTALAFMQTRDDIRFALLFAEDRVQGRRFHPPFNVLGDGASAVLLERDLETARVLETAYFSMGKFCSILGINHWQEHNFNIEEFENKIVPMHYKATRDLISKILERQGLNLDQIALLLYQNMSFNDYRGLAGALGIAMDRIYMDGLKGHGHIFGSDLAINLSLARRQGRIHPGDRILLISSGAGFSWGVTLLEE